MNQHLHLHVAETDVQTGDAFETTILVERLTPKVLLERYGLEVPDLRGSAGLKVVLTPTTDQLMATAEWDWHEFNFEASIAGDANREVKMTIKIWALTPPGDQWDDAVLCETVATMVQQLRGLPVPVPQGIPASRGPIQ